MIAVIVAATLAQAQPSAAQEGAAETAAPAQEEQGALEEQAESAPIDPTPAVLAPSPEPALLPWRPPPVTAALQGPRALRAVPLPVLPDLEWTIDDVGKPDPRQAGCLTQTPGVRPSPACIVALEALYGAEAVGPAVLD